MNYKLGDLVRYAADSAPFEVVGIRADEVEIKGDFSGGTHNVSQKGWVPIAEVSPYVYADAPKWVFVTRKAELNAPSEAYKMELSSGIEIVVFKKNGDEYFFTCAAFHYSGCRTNTTNEFLAKCVAMTEIIAHMEKAVGSIGKLKAAYQNVLAEIRTHE